MLIQQIKRIAAILAAPVPARCGRYRNVPQVIGRNTTNFRLLLALALQASVASASYVDFAGKNGDPTVGELTNTNNWPGGVLPSGSETGRVAQANNVWVGIAKDIQVRLEGGRIKAVGDGIAMRGNVLIEIDTGDWSSVTNLDVGGKTLTMWSQDGGTNELNILNGRVAAGDLNMVSPGKSIIQMGMGALDVDYWKACKGAIHMRAGGSGSMVVATVNSNANFLSDCSFNFETGTRGGITLGEIEGGTSAAGTWEALIASGNLSVDEVIRTDPGFFSITNNGTSTTIQHSGVLPGLTILDGTLYKAGVPYKGIGVNYCDAFQRMVVDSDFSTLDGIEVLGEQGIPFARFWACGFWPSDWDLYFSDKAEWFSRMDLLVATAEAANVGLIPSLFWRWQTVPELMGEYRDAWGDPASDTRQFMSNYVHEVVGRYKDSPAIWGWELCNEFNLFCDLPNWTNGLGTVIPHLGVVGPATEVNESNRMTYAIAESAFNAFSQEVRKLDTHRFITTGNSKPRKNSWNNRMNNSWTVDTYAQAKEAFSWMAPTSSIDMASFHVYPWSMMDGNGDMEYAGASGMADILLRFREFCDDQNQAMFVGEYSSFYNGQGPPPEQERTEEVALLEAIVDSGADLAAYWVYDRGVNRTEGGTIYPSTGEYMGVLDLILEFDAKMRGETWTTSSGVPPAWFEQYGIVPTNWQTWAEIEAQDLNGNGLPLWQDYLTGFQPLETGAVFAITDFQWLENSVPGISWLGGTNGLMTPYVIQSSTNLLDVAAWQTIDTHAREEGTNNWTGTTTADPVSYYRVIAVP